jgi:hypothetical protein
MRLAIVSRAGMNTEHSFEPSAPRQPIQDLVLEHSHWGTLALRFPTQQTLGVSPHGV